MSTVCLHPGIQETIEAVAADAVRIVRTLHERDLPVDFMFNGVTVSVFPHHEPHEVVAQYYALLSARRVLYGTASSTESQRPPKYLRKGSIITITASVYVEVDCEVQAEKLSAVAQDAVTSLLDEYPDLSTRSMGYAIRRARRRRTRRNPGRTRVIPNHPMDPVQ